MVKWEMEVTMNKIEFLKTIPAINELSENTLGKIAGVAEKREARAGETIFSEGDPSDYLYIIESGSVIVSKRLSAGVEKPLSVSGEKSVIGEMSLFTDRARTANLKAKNNVVYWRIPSKELKKLASEDPASMLKLVEKLLLLTLERLEFTSRELATVFEMSKTIARNLTIEEFCQEVVKQIDYSVPDIDDGVLYVWNEFTEEFESPGKLSLDKNHKLIAFIAGRTESAALDEKQSAEMLDGILKVKCAIVAPITHGKLMGLLVLGDTKKFVTYPQSTFDLLNSVSLQLNGAIENIRSRQDLMAKQRFERSRSGSVNW